MNVWISQVCENLKRMLTHPPSADSFQDSTGLYKCVGFLAFRHDPLLRHARYPFIITKMSNWITIIGKPSEANKPDNRFQKLVQHVGSTQFYLQTLKSSNQCSMRHSTVFASYTHSTLRRSSSRQLSLLRKGNQFSEKMPSQNIKRLCKDIKI